MYDGRYGAQRPSSSGYGSSNPGYGAVFPEPTPGRPNTDERTRDRCSTTELRYSLAKRQGPRVAGDGTTVATVAPVVKRGEYKRIKIK